MPQLLQIMCDVCKQPVARTSHTFDLNLEVHTFVVSCHGTTDRCVVPSSFFTEAFVITEAVAFKLERQPTNLPAVLAATTVSHEKCEYDPKSWTSICVDAF